MITINGHILTKEESISLRAALTGFRMSLTKEIFSPSYLSEHKQGMLTIANGYDKHLQRIGQLLTEDQ